VGSLYRRVDGQLRRDLSHVLSPTAPLYEARLAKRMREAADGLVGSLAVADDKAPGGSGMVGA
jgi:hypothetical protein